MVPGQSHNDYAIDKENQIKQGCVAFRLDYLVKENIVSQPDHIKIDVDGLELNVIQGAASIINNCKSILIEVTDNKVLTPLTELGFKVDESMTYQLSKTETNYILRK